MYPPDVYKRQKAVRGRLGNQRRRQIVHQAAVDDRLAMVFDGQLDLGLRVEGRSIGPGAGGGKLGGGGQTQAVEQGEEQHERFPGRHGVGQAAVPEARNEQ